MFKKRDLLEPERKTVVMQNKSGMAVGDVARRLDISRRTVSRIVERFKKERHCSISKEKTTPRDDRLLKRIVQTNRLIVFQLHTE